MASFFTNQLGSGSQQILPTRIRPGAYTAYFFVPYREDDKSPFSGIERGGAAATENKIVGVLCTLETAADASLSLTNEQQLFGLNKAPTSRNDGVALDPLELTFGGNSIATIYAIKSQDPDTNPAFIHTGELGVVGSLIAISFDGANENSRRSTLFRDVKARILQVPGATANGVNTQTVQIYQDRADILELQGQQTWAPFVFRQNGSSIINPAAPDGLLTDFPFKDCNGSIALASVEPFVFDATQVGWKQYLPVLRLDNTTPSTTAVVVATDELQFVSAPADESTLMGIFAVDSSAFEVPMNDPDESAKTSMWYGWDLYLGV